MSTRWVHNDVTGSGDVFASHGFRAWLDYSDAPNLAVCDCGWAPELGEHFVIHQEQRSTDGQPAREGRP
jgi:hypothetical protein